MDLEGWRVNVNRQQHPNRKIHCAQIQQQARHRHGLHPLIRCSLTTRTFPVMVRAIVPGTYGERVSNAAVGCRITEVIKACGSG